MSMIDGGITKRGNGYLRALLVQGAWALKERYEYMMEEKGLGKKKVIVAIARRLGELYSFRHKNITRQNSARNCLAKVWGAQ
jgi:transposase